MDILNTDPLQFILNPAQSIYFLVAKYLFIVISVFFLAVIFNGIFRTSWGAHRIFRDLREFTTFKPYAVQRISKQWQKIQARLDTGMESEYKLAVIEAESILDDIFKRMGYSGESLGERLKSLTPEILANMQDVAEAHRIRNNIVHDPDYKLSLNETKRVVAIYEKSLTDLQAL